MILKNIYGHWKIMGVKFDDKQASQNITLICDLMRKKNKVITELEEMGIFE